jgi:hypothetical protein
MEFFPKRINLPIPLPGHEKFRARKSYGGSRYGIEIPGA